MPGTTQWNRELIHLLFPEYEEKILCLKLSVTGAPDKLIWLGTKSGTYSFKSGYFTALGEGDAEAFADADFDWKKNIWNLDCAPKVKHFAWKILKRALPVGERLVERHIDADPKCKRCGGIESITHLLFQCQYAQKVWLLAPFADQLEYGGIIDLMVDWPSICYQKCLPPTGIPSTSLFPWILWCLWKARNKFVFEGFSASPEDTLSMAINLAREWSANAKAEAGKVSRRGLEYVLEQNVAVVMRSDAAWSATSRVAGLGWSLTSSQQSRTFQQRLEFVSSPLMAEGLALREAVLTCQRLGLRSVRFESDSTTLIKCLNSVLEVAELHSISSDVSAMAAEFFSNVSFVWISREKNSIADGLAKNALVVDETLVVGDAVIAPN